jgi:uncharacterized protein HemX
MDIITPPKTAQESKTPVQDAPVPALQSLPIQPVSPAPKSGKASVITKPPKPSKTPGSGVGLAVFATIVIVLGLGAMMVYAYLRTKGIAIP